MPRSSNVRAKAKKDTPESLAAAVWGAMVPPPLIDEPDGTVYHTGKTYAELTGLTLPTAKHQLNAACKGKGGKPAKLQKAEYRIRDQRQVQWVYWPVGVVAPDEAGK
jgi:hypothetical protein